MLELIYTPIMDSELITLVTMCGAYCLAAEKRDTAL